MIGVVVAVVSAWLLIGANDTGKTPSAAEAGRAYLRIVGPTNAAAAKATQDIANQDLAAYGSDAVAWADALDREVRALAAADWPASASKDIDKLIAKDRTLASALRDVAALSKEATDTSAAKAKAAQAVLGLSGATSAKHDAANAVRADLGLPSADASSPTESPSSDTTGPSAAKCIEGAKRALRVLNPLYKKVVLRKGQDAVALQYGVTGWMGDYLRVEQKLTQLGCSDEVDGLDVVSTAVAQYSSLYGPADLTDALNKASAQLGVAGPNQATGASSADSITRYPHPGFVYDQASADKNLPGVPDAFKQYVAQEGADPHAQSPKLCSEQGGAQVDAYDKRGYAVGAVLGCGGAATLWYETSAGWKEISTQEGWLCTDLQRLGVPSALFAPNYRVCETKNYAKEVPYDHP